MRMIDFFSDGFHGHGPCSPAVVYNCLSPVDLPGHLRGCYTVLCSGVYSIKVVPFFQPRVCASRHTVYLHGDCTHDVVADLCFKKGNVFPLPRIRRNRDRAVVRENMSFPNPAYPPDSASRSSSACWFSAGLARGRA